jgi:hypothetical protein
MDTKRLYVRNLHRNDANVVINESAWVRRLYIQAVGVYKRSTRASQLASAGVHLKLLIFSGVPTYRVSHVVQYLVRTVNSRSTGSVGKVEVSPTQPLPVSRLIFVLSHRRFSS